MPSTCRMCLIVGLSRMKGRDLAGTTSAQYRIRLISWQHRGKPRCLCAHGFLTTTSMVMACPSILCALRGPRPWYLEKILVATMPAGQLSLKSSPARKKFGAAEKHGKTQFTILVNAEKSKHWSSSPTVSFPRPSKRPSQQHRWFLEDAANGPLGADGRGPTSLELGSGAPDSVGSVGRNGGGSLEASLLIDDGRSYLQQGATRESWTNLIQLSSTLQTRRRPSLSPLVMQFCKSLRNCLLLPTTQVRLVRVLRIAKFARHSEAPGCNQHPLDWDFPCPQCLSDIAIHGPP